MHPILFETPFITFYSYGLCVALAMGLAVSLASVRSCRDKVLFSEAVDLLFVVFLAGMAGARIFYVLQHWEHYRSDWLGILRLQEGGLVWYGGFVSSVSAAALYCYFKKWPILKWADFFAPILALAHAVGRVGCFLNGCCYGLETHLGWGVTFPDATVRRHPVQLYESSALVILGLILWAVSGSNKRPGRVFLFYMLGYGLLRFAIEFLRADQDLFFHLTLPQWISVTLILSAAIFLGRIGDERDERRR